jgi:hypothetical protein
MGRGTFAFPRVSTDLGLPRPTQLRETIAKQENRHDMFEEARKTRPDHRFEIDYLFRLMTSSGTVRHI